MIIPLHLRCLLPGEHLSRSLGANKHDWEFVFVVLKYSYSWNHGGIYCSANQANFQVKMQNTCLEWQSFFPFLFPTGLQVRLNGTVSPVTHRTRGIYSLWGILQSHFRQIRYYCESVTYVQGWKTGQMIPFDLHAA